MEAFSCVASFDSTLDLPGLKQTLVKKFGHDEQDETGLFLKSANCSVIILFIMSILSNSGLLSGFLRFLFESSQVSSLMEL